MKKILALLLSLMLLASVAFALDLKDMKIDTDSGVQENGLFGLFLESQDQKNIFYISVTPKPNARTITSATLMLDGEMYVPVDLLWYRQDDYFIAPIMLANQESGFSTYAEIYDSKEDGVELYMGYVEDELQCFGGPDDLIWSLLMDNKLDLYVYDEWGYFMDEIHVTVADDTKDLLSKFSYFIQNTFKPLF